MKAFFLVWSLESKQCIANVNGISGVYIINLNKNNASQLLLYWRYTELDCTLEKNVNKNNMLCYVHSILHIIITFQPRWIYLHANKKKTNREQWISKWNANRRFYFRITTTEHYRLIHFFLTFSFCFDACQRDQTGWWLFLR